MLNLDDCRGASSSDKSGHAVRPRPLMNPDDAARLAKMKIDHALLRHKVKTRLIVPEPTKQDVVRL